MSSEQTRAWVMDVGASWRLAAGTHHVVEFVLGPEILKVPCTRRQVAGVMWWRDKFLPVIDLTLKRARLRSMPRVMVLAYQEAPETPLQHGALMVRGVPREVIVGDDMACDLPDDLQVLSNCTHACFTEDERNVLVLDTTKLFCAPPPAVVVEEPAEQEEVEDVERPITQHSSRSLKAREIIEGGLWKIHKDVGFGRVLFAAANPEQMSMNARFFQGVEADSPLRALSFERSGPSLFARLVTKPQHVRVSKKNSREALATLTPGMREHFASEFCASAIFAGRRLVGLCYGDVAKGDELDDRRYAQFKRLCTNMSKSLSAIA